MSVHNETPPTMAMLLREATEERKAEKRTERKMMIEFDADTSLRGSLGGFDPIEVFSCSPEEMDKMIAMGPPSWFSRERWNEVKSSDEEEEEEKMKKKMKKKRKKKVEEEEEEEKDKIVQLPARKRHKNTVLEVFTENERVNDA